MLSDVLHQNEAVRFLRSLVEGRFNDPLLLVGEEGTGRRFSALQAIKEVYCEGERKSPCTCSACYQVDEGCHPDLIFITPKDGKEIKVDTIREMIPLAWKAPQVSSRRFILLDGVDKITSEGANALLKVLEEPPPLARFLLLAESYHRVIPTIRSRCGRISYQPLPDTFVLSVVQRFEKDHVKASIYAGMGEGSVGRSVSYLGAGRLSLRDRVFGLVQSALDGDLPILFSVIDGIDKDKDLPLALRFVDHLLHDLLMVSSTPNRMINLDQVDVVQRMRGKRDLSVWVKLGDGVQRVRELSRRTSINMSFHVKALFADTFTLV